MITAHTFTYNVNHVTVVSKVILTLNYIYNSRMRVPNMRRCFIFGCQFLYSAGEMFYIKNCDKVF